jgi:predicted transcriptional regulator
MANPDTRVITSHVPVPLADQVDALAARMERSRGWIVKQALTAWVEEEEERHRLTLEALAETDAGPGIPHERVKEWSDSLTRGQPLAAPTCD